MNIIFQDIREKNENTRISNEMVRQNNELLRSEKDILRDKRMETINSNEELRLQNEINRNKLEQTLKDNEDIRKKNFNDIMTGLNSLDLKNTIETEVISARGNAQNLNERFQNISDELTKINSQISDIIYEPIKIISFNSDKTILEKGQIINRIVLSWELNIQPLTQMIDGKVIDSNLREYVIEDTFSENTDFTLEVTDSKGNKDTKTITLKFLNKVYFGTSNRVKNDTTLITSLQNKVLSEEKIKNISLTANSNEYMVYCIPSDFGECHFYIFGFEDGFNKVATIIYTNEYGNDCEYDIYRSENSGLGTLNIEIR